MIFIWIGIFIIIPAVVLVFALSMGKSAAQADKEFERAQIAELRTWSGTPERIESNKDLLTSPDTKRATRLNTRMRIPSR